MTHGFKSPGRSGTVALPHLIAIFFAFTVLVLASSLPVSCVSGFRLGGTSSPWSGTRTAAAPPISPLGTRPAHLRTDPVSVVPNQQAITQALWAPGIDLGYVPQGLSFAEGHILVSGYRSTSPADSMGPCRVYRLDPDSGVSTGYFDLPPECGHAGGLAYAGGGVLLVSDTRRLYRIDLETALRERHADTAITGILELGGELRGSSAAFVPAPAMPGRQALASSAGMTTSAPAFVGPGAAGANGPGMFIAAWSTSENTARGYFLPLSLFDSHNGRLITENNAVGTLALGTRAQGGSFAPDGSLWLSYSSHDFGRLEQLDPANGRLLAGHEMVSGIEDIGFDDRGELWAVSEAGSLRWRGWRTSFPLVFRLDLSVME